MIIDRINFKKVVKVLSKTLVNKIVEITINDKYFIITYTNGHMKLKISNYNLVNYKFKCNIKEFANLLEYFTNRRSRSIKIGYLIVVEDKLYYSINALKFEKFIEIERID